MSVKEGMSKFGKFLSGMVMPNIGAFIAWGFLTALFTGSGWLPNEAFAQMISPMLSYLIPVLIAAQGGYLVGGDRGRIIGAIAVIGRESGSGTRDGFESITGTEDQCVLAQELSSTGAVIEAVRTTPGAIGYASLSAVQDQKGITVLTVGGVAPSEATVLDGSYAIQRPFVFATRTDEALSDAAQAFFDFATSTAASDLIANAGAVPQ